jgi:hypothetical protein
MEFDCWFAAGLFCGNLVLWWIVTPAIDKRPRRKEDFWKGFTIGGLAVLILAMLCTF